MRKIKLGIMMLLMCVLVGFGPAPESTRAEAAALSNVLKAPKIKAGMWVISSKGYRYRYSSNKKYAKSVWRKVDGSIYYFKSNGYLQTGWKTYNKKKYYFNGHGILQTGWKTIGSKRYYFSVKNGAMVTGKVKIGSKYYYFNSSGVRKTGWIKIGSYWYYFKPSNGSMAVSTKVGNYYVDKNGRRTTSKPASGSSSGSTSGTTLTKTGKVDYFVGDSRTVGMCEVKKINSKCIAKVGEGYNWYKSTALPKLKAKLKAKPTATVVLNFGVNDITNYSKYITAYKSLIKAYPKAKIYIMSVNPIDSKYTWGYYSCSKMKSKIKTFNSKMKAAFPGRYIDCYTYLTKNGFSTSDGIHYTSATYKKIYSYILTQV